MVLFNVTPCFLVHRYQPFGEIYCSVVSVRESEDGSIRSPKNFIHIYQTTRCHNSKDHKILIQHISYQLISEGLIWQRTSCGLSAFPNL